MWGSQFARNANIMSEMNRLKSRGDRGSPCQSPTLEEKGWPNIEPSLILEVVLMYVFSISVQNFGPLITIFRNRRGLLTLSYAFCKSMKAA